MKRVGNVQRQIKVRAHYVNHKPFDVYHNFDTTEDIDLEWHIHFYLILVFEITLHHF